MGRHYRTMKLMQKWVMWNQKMTDWILPRKVQSRLKTTIVMFQRTVKRVQRMKKQMVVASRCRKKRLGSVENC